MACSTRSSFLAASAAAFASIAFVRSRGDAAQFAYIYGHDMPVDHPLHIASIEMWDAVRTESGGRLSVQVFPANQLGSDSAMLTQIRSGATQFAALSGPIISAVVPITEIYSVPFAFTDDAHVFGALDGPLGNYLRAQMAAKGITALPYMYALGFREITSSTHPIRVADDFAGFKIRIPPSKLYVDAFKTLGASPASIGTAEIYTALQTKVVDGQETPYAVIETLKFFDVQKYLSATNHIWSGYWVLANTDAWKALPPDIVATVLRNQKKYALQERHGVQLLNASLADKLTRRGMIFNTADVTTFKTRLQPFYTRWRDEFGPTAWGLLEEAVGKIA